MNDPSTAFPADKFIRLADVPLLDEHSLPRGPGGRTTVTSKDLEQIAVNNNKRWKETRDATAVCIGHTIEDAPETEQPPLVGWAVNFKTGPFFETGRTALFADFYIRKEDEAAIEKYPRRSVEYWIGKKQVEPISLLSSTTPERDLGVLKFHRDANDTVYRYSLKSPKPISPDAGNQTLMPDPKPTDVTNPAPDADAAKMVEMVLSSKPMQELLQTVSQFKSLMDELEAEGGPEGQHGNEEGDDLLQPVDDDDDADAEKDTDDDKGKSKGKDKEQRNLNEPAPVKFDANATNSYVPTTEPKTKMSRDTDEVLKYKREFEQFKMETEKKYKEQAVKYQRLKAEKAVADMETEGVDFTDKANRGRELDLMSNLSDAAFDTHVKRIKLNYKRKGPDSAGVAEALKYSRSVTDATVKGPTSDADAVAYAEAALRAGKPDLDYADYLAKHPGK